MAFRDAMDHIASADEFPSRDEREASLFDEYDAPDEMPASAIYAARSIGTTTPANPLLMQRLAGIEEAEYGHLPNVIGLPAETKRGAA